MKTFLATALATAVLLLGSLATSSLSFSQTASSGNEQTVPASEQSSRVVPGPWQTGFEAMAQKAIGRRVALIFTLNGKAIGLTGPAANAAAPIDADVATITAGQGRIMAMLKESGASDIQLVNGMPFVGATVNAEQLRSLAATGLFAGVDENIIVQPQLGQSLTLMQVPAYWAANNHKGSGQIVAVIDTGVKASHPFLAGRKDIGACFSTTNQNANITQAGCSLGSGPGFGEPCTLHAGCDHGTHAAGIAVGGQYPGKSINGVAPSAKFMPIEVFGKSGDGKLNAHGIDLLNALSFVRSQKLLGKRIASVNMSLGGGAYTNACGGPIEAAILDLRNKGVATVISSGNDGFANAVAFPGCSPSAITIAATDKNNAIAGYSNLSAQVDLLATGGAAGSYANGIESSVPSGGFASMHGTSMAAPHVAGAFALLRQTYPCHSVALLENKLKATGLLRSRAGTPGAFPLMQIHAARLQIPPSGIACKIDTGNPRSVMGSAAKLALPHDP